MSEIVDLGQHRTVLSSALEKESVIMESSLRNFFANEDSKLELWQKNKEGESCSYHLDIYVPLLSSRQVPHKIGEFQEESSGREAYEKILTTIKRGGKIFLDLLMPLPSLISSEGRGIEIIENSKERFSYGECLGE